MRCASCGTENAEGASYCSRCGRRIQEQPFRAARPIQHVPNYLAPAILTTLFCCLPAGIVSIVYAAQVNGYVVAGDLEGALRSSDSAKTWAWISFVLGVATVVISVVFLIILPFVFAERS